MILARLDAHEQFVRSHCSMQFSMFYRTSSFRSGDSKGNGSVRRKEEMSARRYQLPPRTLLVHILILLLLLNRGEVFRGNLLARSLQQCQLPVLSGFAAQRPFDA